MSFLVIFSGPSGVSRKRQLDDADLYSSDDDAIFVEPSSVAAYSSSDITLLLSKADAEERAKEVATLKERFGDDELGWGAKVATTKYADRDVISAVSLSVTPWLNQRRNLSDLSDSFSIVLLSGLTDPSLRQERHAGYRNFPPIRVRVELSLTEKKANFFVNCSWLVKEHVRKSAPEIA